jgi:hypothetical protein
MPIGRSHRPRRPAPQPTLALAVVLAVTVAVVLAVACSLSSPTTNVISTEGGDFAAAVERSLYFVLGFAFGFAVAVAVLFFLVQTQEPSFRPEMLTLL